MVDFNPHSHEGSDHHGPKSLMYISDFNPHSHEGSDHTIKLDASDYDDFNPHSHEGSDKSLIQLLHTSVISIHTPTKGATKADIA